MFADATTLTSTGAVDSFHDSYTSLGGMITMFNMQLGEVAPGGAGSGLYGMLILAIITVFVAGLMVGRTPEYLGKKITPREIKLAASVFPDHAADRADRHRRRDGACPANEPACSTPARTGSRRCCTRSPPRPTTTARRSRASRVNTEWYNTALGLAMVFGRFLPMIFVLALAGSLAKQGSTPASIGTLPTHRPQFVGMVAGVTLILVALTFLPDARARPPR